MRKGILVHQALGGSRFDETLPALQHDVAAYKAQSKQKSKQQQQTSNTATARRRKVQRDPDDRDTWGNPHKDRAGKTPPSTICMQHYCFGKKAHFCRLPESCPWKHITSPPNDQK